MYNQAYALQAREGGQRRRGAGAAAWGPCAYPGPCAHLSRSRELIRPRKRPTRPPARYQRLANGDNVPYEQTFRAVTHTFNVGRAPFGVRTFFVRSPSLCLPLLSSLAHAAAPCGPGCLPARRWAFGKLWKAAPC